MANKKKYDIKKLNKDEILSFYNLNNKSLTKTGQYFNIDRNFLKKFLDIKKINKICSICNSNFDTYNNRQKYCSVECRKEFKRKYLKENNYLYDKLIIWRLENKKKAVEYKGGKCIFCGYNKCLRSLEFHHIDPKEKEYTISKYKGIFEKMKDELDKCILVCSNCHGEIHDGIIKI